MRTEASWLMIWGTWVPLSTCYNTL